MPRPFDMNKAIKETFGTRLSLALALGLLVAASNASGQSPTASPSPPAPGGNTALEALQRLKGLDLEANPTLKAAVLRVLATTRGTPAFVDLVRDFNLDGQESGLLEVAAALPAEAAGPEAIRLVLHSGRAEALRTAVREGPAERRAGLVQALANSAEVAGIPLLIEVAQDSGAPGDLRSTAVRGLGRTETGARELLKLGREGRLVEGLRTSASLSLAQSRWPAIREEASQVFPSPRAADGAELPPLRELVQQSGDAARGSKVFRSERAACIKCHRVGEEGIDFGPALTQIGTKLGKQALYDSILDPSAGISFGYEGWTLVLKNGDEVFGILASETAEELAIKQQTGAVVRVRKPEITSRDRQKLSAMPAGLGQLLTRQELVDLVEYLTTLKAP